MMSAILFINISLLAIKVGDFWWFIAMGMRVCGLFCRVLLIFCFRFLTTRVSVLFVLISLFFFPPFAWLRILYWPFLWFPYLLLLTYLLICFVTSIFLLNLHCHFPVFLVHDFKLTNLFFDFLTYYSLLISLLQFPYLTFTSISLFSLRITSNTLLTTPPITRHLA